MAMIGGPLVKRPVRSSASGELLSPLDSQVGLSQVLQNALPSQSPGPLAPVSADLMAAATNVAPYMSPQLPSASNLPQIAPHHKFFTDDGTGTGNRILGMIGDGLLGAAGQPGTYAKTMEARHQEQTAFERGEVQYQRRRADELTDRAADANKVQYFSGNEDRVAYDPSTGTARTLYDAPTAPQAYATTLGLTPGSPAYSSAIKDYVLRSNGPTAFEGRDALQTDRYGFMSQLQAPRLANSRRNTDARTSASIANNMRTTAATQRGQTMTDARTRGSAAYQGRSGRGGGGAAAVAVGPNGHRIVVKGGRWVDAQTGAPVQ